MNAIRLGIALFSIAGANPLIAATLTLQTDSAVTSVIGPEGGVAIVPGFAELRFPRGTFSQPESVTIRITNTPTTATGLQDYDLGGAGSPPYLSFDVHLEVAVAPAGQFELLIRLDSGFLDSVPAQMTPTVFRQFAGGGPMEDLRLYEALTSEIDLARRTIRAAVSAPPGSRILPEVFVVGCRYR